MRRYCRRRGVCDKGSDSTPCRSRSGTIRSDSSMAASARPVLVITECRELAATRGRPRGVFHAHTSMSSPRV